MRETLREVDQLLSRTPTIAICAHCLEVKDCLNVKGLALCADCRRDADRGALLIAIDAGPS
jgi:hypothetical protein